MKTLIQMSSVILLLLFLQIDSGILLTNLQVTRNLLLELRYQYFLPYYKMDKFTLGNPYQEIHVFYRLLVQYDE